VSIIRKIILIKNTILESNQLCTKGLLTYICIKEEIVSPFNESNIIYVIIHNIDICSVSTFEKSTKMVGKWKLLIMSCQTECIWKIESVATWIEQSCILLLSYFRLYLLSKLLKLFGFPIFWLWVYLMKVAPESCCAHLIWYLRFYCIYSCIYGDLT
jgi:hypothetical protein